MSMRFQGNFETFKFVDQGGRIQSVMDYIEGESVFYKIQNYKQFSKSELLKWLSDLCLQLEYYHKYKYQAYQYLNPYTIIITKDQQVRLLNMDSKENEDVLIYIQKTMIRELFYYQSNAKKGKIYTDFYSFGKILQFLLSSGEFTPRLKVRELRTFSKIIQKCLSNESDYQYQNMKQIQKKIPKCKEIKQGKPISNIILHFENVEYKKLVGVVLGILVIGVLGGVYIQNQVEQNLESPNTDVQGGISDIQKDSSTEEYNQLCFKLGEIILESMEQQEIEDIQNLVEGIE